MGAGDTWQVRLPPRRSWLRRGRNDRDDIGAQRSRIMLISGGVLLLLAMFVARSLPQQHGIGAERTAITMVPAGVAATAVGFGEKLTPEKLKIVDVPAQGLPKGSFQRIDQLMQGPGRTTMREIGVGEVLIEAALVAGATRLSAAPLLTPMMRALAVEVNEVSGVSGLVTPGDRVDVFMTRQPEEALPHAELVAQNLLVLAVGSDMNIARDKPGAVKTATLEVTPAQAQKLTLAMATGQISLALRQFSDTQGVRLQSLQVSDLNDGTITRLVRKPGSQPAAAPAERSPAAARPARNVIVMRGGEPSQTHLLP